MSKPFFLELMNQKTKSGAGCVDTAFRAKTELAKLLVQFGAVEQRPPPAKGRNNTKGGGNTWKGGVVAEAASGEDAGKGGGNTWSWNSGSDVAAASGHVEPDPWAAWNANASSSSHWNQNTWGEWGVSTWRQERSRNRAASPRPGQYDHRGTDASVKGTGMYAHDRRMKKYEDGAEDGDSDIPSEDSERSD